MVSTSEFESKLTSKDDILDIAMIAKVKQRKWRIEIDRIFKKIFEKIKIGESDLTLRFEDYPPDMRDYIISQFRDFGYLLIVNNTEDDYPKTIDIVWEDFLKNDAPECETKEFDNFLSAKMANEITKKNITNLVCTIDQKIITKATQGGNSCVISKHIPEIVMDLIAEKGYKLNKEEDHYIISWSD